MNRPFEILSLKRGEPPDCAVFVYYVNYWQVFPRVVEAEAI